MPETVAPPITTDAAPVDPVAAAAAAQAASTDAAATTPSAVTTPAGGAATPEAVVTPAVAAVPVVPETYDLKLPDGSTVDPAIVERTAAIARELGLSNEAGQKLLDQTVQDLTERDAARDAEAKKAADAAQSAFVEAWKPGGAEWEKRNAEWIKQAQADPDLGRTPQDFAVTLEKAKQALGKYAPPELTTLLDSTGFGSHPAVLKLLANIGRAMSEGSLVRGTGGNVTRPKTDAEVLYPQHYQGSTT